MLAYNQVQFPSCCTKISLKVKNAPITSGFLPPPQPLLLVEDEDVLAKARSLSHLSLCLLPPSSSFSLSITVCRAESTIPKMYMVHADDTSTKKLE